MHPFSPRCCADVQLASSPDHQRYPRLPSSAASSRSSVSSSPGKKRQHQPHPNAASSRNSSRYPQVTAVAHTAGGRVGPTLQIPVATATLAGSQHPQQLAQKSSTGGSSEYYSYDSYGQQHHHQHQRHTRENYHGDTRHRCSSSPENPRNSKSSEAVSRDSPRGVLAPAAVGTAASSQASSSVRRKNSDDSERDMISLLAGRSESSRTINVEDVASTGRTGTVDSGAESKRENMEKAWSDNRCIGGGPRGSILPPRTRGGAVGSWGTMSGGGNGGDRTLQINQRPQQRLRTSVRGGAGGSGRVRGFDAAPYETTVLFRDR